MAQNKEHQPQQQQQHQSKKEILSNNANNNQNNGAKKPTPMIVERVNRIAVVNAAVAMGFTQYDKLKSSNVTVGDVMKRVEHMAFTLWTLASPYIEKIQEPLDQIACNAFDYVETKITNRSQTVQTQ